MEYNFDEVIDRRSVNGEKWNLYPENVLPMWVADSDFRSPEPVVQALLKRVEHGLFGYNNDSLKLIENAAAHWMATRHGWKVQPEWVSFGSSVSVLMALCVQAFTRPGDKVAFFTPSYPPFFAIPLENGRLLATSSLVHNGDSFAIDFDDLEQKLADPRTRLFLLCNPQNPTGRVFSREELVKIGELCAKHNVLVFSDEIHCDYVYDSKKHIPFASIAPELAEISLVAINPSKTFNIADMRTAAVISSNKNLLVRYNNALAAAHIGRSSLGILAFSVAYMECADYVDQLVPYIEKNLHHAVQRLTTESATIRAYMPEATYLLWLDCKSLNLSQPELKKFFLEKACVALNSGETFGAEGLGWMRMNLACPRSILDEGLNRVIDAVNRFA